jgi:hypothetical protein
VASSDESRGVVLESGWAILSDMYETSAPFAGESWGFQSGQIGVRDEFDPSLEGMQAYGYCLHFGANREGLRIVRVIPLGKLNPPLFIPWDDVSASPAEGVFFRKMRLDFRRAPRVSLYILERLARELLKHAGWFSHSAT